MSYFFTESLINKVKNMVGEPKCVEVNHSEAASIARSIVQMIEPDDVIKKGEVVYIGPSTSTASKKKYDSKMLARVEEELKNEMHNLFGVNANVSFSYGGKVEEETENSAKEPMYYYGLSISVPV